MASYEPLRVVARMGSSVVGDFIFPLDSIVLYACAERAYGLRPMQKPNEALSFDPTISPIAIENNGGNWFYRASFARYANGYLEGQMFWNKRLRDEYLDLLNAKNVNTSSGAYKQYHTPYAYRFAPLVTWYVFADKVALEDILNDIPAIGKETNIGHGLVLDWVVTPIAQDFSLIDPDGHAMRALPLSWAKAHDVRGKRAYRTLRPPYWHRSSYQEVVFEAR